MSEVINQTTVSNVKCCCPCVAFALESVHDGGEVRRLIPIVLASVAALAAASSAAALDVPVSQLRALAQTYEPGVFLPTVFPRSIVKVDVGAASGIGNGPAPSHFLEYHAAAKGAFQLGVWRGDRAAAVLKGLAFHDGTRGATRALRRGDSGVQGKPSPRSRRASRTSSPTSGRAAASPTCSSSSRSRARRRRAIRA